MNSSTGLSDKDIAFLKERGVDLELSLSILDDYNRGIVGQEAEVIPRDVPAVDGKTIIDMRNSSEFSISPEERRRFISSYPDASAYLPDSGRDSLSREELERLGIALLPLFSYGFLNGGSATSYGDTKKNRGFNERLYTLYEPEFEKLAARSKGQPKGVTPGFLQPSGEGGPSYMELKLRALLLLGQSYSELTGRRALNIPFFQMTSVSNDPDVAQALEEYNESPWLQTLAGSLEIEPWKGYTAVQPLVTAYSHSSRGKKKEIFRPFVTIPGGHGQCFRVLKECWQTLYDSGIRFISLGNIDNLGYTPDPAELALLALRNRPAGFDESFKTAVDTKGGILITDSRGKLNCVDLGVGISHKEASALEQRGKDILFNCGSGLFNLRWLLDNIDRIIRDLPLRFSDQNKDAGMYSQAEQVTWEVIGMIDNPLIFAVDKYERFLAAKILLENMMTSGLKIDDSAFPSEGEEALIRETAMNLHRGLKSILSSTYGLKLYKNRWIPRESEGYEP